MIGYFDSFRLFALVAATATPPVLPPRNPELGRGARNLLGSAPLA